MQGRAQAPAAVLLDCNQRALSVLQLHQGARLVLQLLQHAQAAAAAASGTPVSHLRLLCRLLQVQQLLCAASWLPRLKQRPWPGQAQALPL